MDLTAESLQQVKFGAKVRGYDPEEVDRFIATVTELGEELHERLRRATDRAQKAEQQLAAAAAAPAPAPAPSGPSQDLGRIWERAVAAADAAVEEAKQEAQRILDDAHRSSDEAVSRARQDAERLVEESQGQLRADIERLEGARAQLQTDVSGLTEFLSGEKSRLRSSIAAALAAVDEYGSTSDSPPSVSSIDIPAEPARNDNGGYAAFTPPQPAPEPEANPFDQYSAPAEQRQFEQPVFEQPSYEPEPEPEPYREEQQPAWANDEVAQAPNHPQQEEQPADDGGDPFLAELRRAVRDDGPLGPREDVEEDSIDRLYADDDDDKSFFKRKK